MVVVGRKGGKECGRFWTRTPSIYTFPEPCPARLGTTSRPYHRTDVKAHVRETLFEHTAFELEGVDRLQ